MATLTDVINEVIEDTGRYELSDSTTFRDGIVSKAQNFLELMLGQDTLLLKSYQVLLTTGIYGASIPRVKYLTAAWVSETGVFRNQLELTDLNRLLETANQTLDVSNRGIPEYLAFGQADSSVFTDSFLASPNPNGIVVYPVPDRSVTIRLSGAFLPEVLSIGTASSHIFLSDYKNLFILAMKAQLEFVIRNMEGFNQYKQELLDQKTQYLMNQINTEWNSINTMEA